MANGTRTSTAITLSLKDDLGMSSSATGSTQSKAVESAYAQMGMQPQVVFEALLADCPFDLYWFDKGVSTGYSFGYTYWEYSDGTYKVTLNTVTFKFPVAADFAGSSEFTVDSSKTTAVKTALNTINSIVTANRGLSDYDKLLAYKNRICELTSYNYSAAGSASSHYVNPWQLIWVFDNDSSTNVVCEGYAKAFQYLCDRSDFNGPVYCLSVTGTMADSSNKGPHMWNIVHMDDGLNYLVDVTSCDEGMTGEPDYLFMVKPTSGSVDDKYRFKFGIFSIDYWYDSNARAVNREEDLMLSRSNYKDVRENDYFLEPVLWAVENNITKGTSDITFSPSAACTRAQAVTFLWRTNGSRRYPFARNPFTDVDSSAYYYNAVLWAVRSSVTNGLSETIFGPDVKCTRGQIVTFLWRAAGEPSSVAKVTFTDISQNAYYYTAVRWAVEQGITNGTTASTFSPDAYCTRGQIVTFLYRAMV